ncbi:PucR family transcriptional regulator [Alkalihalobacillus sp. NPDC078783]
MLTMKDVMELDILKTAAIKTAHPRLHERVVEWVSITEAPVENFVRKNEMVLTTGIGYAQEPERFYEFVQDVIQSGASGLGVATGRYILDIDQLCMELAEEHDFPIICLPWEVRFADVTQSITTKILDIKQGYMDELQIIGQELLSIVLGGGSLLQLTHYISSELHLSTYITDDKGELMGPVSLENEEQSSWVTLMRDQADSLAQPIPGSQSHPLLTKVETGSTSYGTFLRLPILQGKQVVQGYVYMILDHHPPSVPDTFFIVLEHIGTAAAFWFLRENAVLEAQAKVKNHFVWELAKDLFRSVEEMQSRAKALGYHLDLPYVAIVGYPDVTHSFFGDTAHDAWSVSLEHYVEKEVNHVARSIHHQAMSTSQNNQLIIFLEVTEDAERETVHSFLDLMNRRLMNLFPSMNMDWGIGDGGSSLSSFSQSYEQAFQALQIGKRRNDRSRRVFYSDTRVDRVLQAMGDDPELYDVVLEVITPLYQYDLKRSMDLIGTFTTYHRNQSKISQTARVLHLHRQSLLYRLRKIETLTHLSLANPDDVFLLELSIRIWQMQKKD